MRRFHLHCLPTDGVNSDVDHGATVDGPNEHTVSDLLLDRATFSRERAFVKRRVVVPDVDERAVRRRSRTMLDTHNVADFEEVSGHAHERRPPSQLLDVRTISQALLRVVRVRESQGGRGEGDITW